MHTEDGLFTQIQELKRAIDFAETPGFIVQLLRLTYVHTSCVQKDNTEEDEGVYGRL